MPSTPTTRNRFIKQAAGEGLNVWGVLLNSGAFDLIDVALDGWTTKALTGDYTLTTVNYSPDEARSRTLKFTGAGPFTVTIPSVEKWYHVWNACTAALTITTGAGDTVTLAVGEVAPIICDASNVKRVKVIDYGSDNVSSSAVPTSANHFTNKTYVDGLAFAAVNLPGQNAGTVNQFIKSNGTTASWETITVADVTGAAPLASPSFTGDATVAGALTVTGNASITGNADLTGDLAVGSLSIDSDVVPFPKWKAGGASGSVTELVIPLDDSFEAWDLHLRNVTMASAGRMLATLSFDAGGSYKAGATDYAYQAVWQSGSGSTATSETRNTAAALRLMDDTGASATTEASDLSLRITSKAGRETRVWSEFGAESATVGDAVMGLYFTATNLKNYGKASHIKITHSAAAAFTVDYSIYGVR